MQALLRPSVTSLPPRPACLVFYTGDACDQSIQQYNLIVAERKQQEWEVRVAGPLQQQIADQQKQIADQQAQIKALQLTIESQTMTVLQREARDRASLDILGAILGVGLAFLVAFASFRRLARNTTVLNPEPEHSLAARAGR